MTGLGTLDGQLLALLDGALALVGDGGARGIRHAARLITPLGGSPVLATIVAASAGWLVLRRRPAEAAWLVITCVAAWAAMHATKFAVGRARPDAAGHLVEAVGASFPSGHAMMSMVVAASLWRLAARMPDAPGSRGLTIGAGVAAGLLVLAIGASRVLVGVHWPTDVLAGWAIGAGWAALAGRRLPPRT